jgi:hypothetical protein
MFAQGESAPVPNFRVPLHDAYSTRDGVNPFGSSRLGLSTLSLSRARSRFPGGSSVALNFHDLAETLQKREALLSRRSPSQNLVFPTQPRFLPAPPAPASRLFASPIFTPRQLHSSHSFCPNQHTPCLSCHRALPPPPLARTETREDPDGAILPAALEVVTGELTLPFAAVLCSRKGFPLSDLFSRSGRVKASCPINKSFHPEPHAIRGCRVRPQSGTHARNVITATCWSRSVLMLLQASFKWHQDLPPRLYHTVQPVFHREFRRHATTQRQRSPSPVC